VVDGKIYVIGGSPSLWFTPVFTMEVYEPATDSWTQKGDVPCASSTSFASVVDGKIYAFGGYVCSWRVHEYDPVTDTWIQKADMPTYRVALFGSVLDGKIYAIGGHQGVSPYPGLATVEVYDPETDTWTTGPDMPTGRWGPSTSVVDGKIYAIGGIDNYPAAACGTVEEYTPPSPVIDFNGDGRIDFKDFAILALYWNQNEPSVDIAPEPFGDDMVNFKDLRVFAENWLIGTRKASNPHPWNGARDVDINADLSWTAGVDATSHDVYFGTTSPPPFIRNQAATTYEPGTLAENTGHYWRIDEVGDYGTTTGTVWRFTSGWGGPPP
jgi:hypothetical protein